MTKSAKCGPHTEHCYDAWEVSRGSHGKRVRSFDILLQKMNHVLPLLIWLNNYRHNYICIILILKKSKFLLFKKAMHPHYTHRLISDAQENNNCFDSEKIIVFTVETILVTMLIKLTMPHVLVCSHTCTTGDLFHFHVSKFARHSIRDTPFTCVQEQLTCVFHTKRIHLLEAELYWHAKPVLYVPRYHCGASLCDTFWRVTNEYTPQFFLICLSVRKNSRTGEGIFMKSYTVEFQ